MCWKQATSRALEAAAGSGMGTSCVEPDSWQGGVGSDAFELSLAATEARASGYQALQTAVGVWDCTAAALHSEALLKFKCAACLWACSRPFWWVYILQRFMQGIAPELPTHK